jgi:hypothetical protein
MHLIFRLFLGLCLFRKTPQDVPYSVFLFVFTLCLNVVLSLINLLFLVEESRQPEFIDAVQYIAIRTVLFLVIIYSIMFMLGFRNRIIQTLTAIQGADIILGVVFLVLGSGLSLLPPGSPVLILVIMLFLGWSLAVHSNIYRHALSISLFTAGFLAVGLFFLEILIEQQFSPVMM